MKKGIIIWLPCGYLISDSKIDLSKVREQQPLAIREYSRQEIPKELFFLKTKTLPK